MQSAFSPNSAPSAALTYQVEGLGESTPLVVADGTRQSFMTGMTIAQAERRRILKEISTFSIPQPRRPLASRPSEPIVVSDAPLRPSPKALFVPGEGMPTPQPSNIWLDRLRHLGPRLTSLWGRPAEASLVTNILAAAKPGQILICGDARLSRSLQGALASHGRSTVLFNPTDPPTSARAGGSVLGRPARSSLLDTLKRQHGALQDVGAVLLAGEHDFAAECGAIGDCPSPPPVLMVKPGAIGPAVAPVDLSRASGPSPKISVVSVSYNQAQYLEASIRSVIDQGYDNLDYVIVDGGSTDGSVEIIERYRAHFSHVVIEPDSGQSNALNKGFRLATGDVMNWLCSDDLLMPGSLQAIADAWRLHDADLIVGGCLRIRETVDDVIHEHHAAIPLGVTLALDPYDILQFTGSWQKGNYFFQPEVFFSKRIWDGAGGYLKEHLYYAMDYDMWLRMGLAGATVRVIPPMIGCSRVHEAQKTKDDRVYMHQLARMMDEYEDMFAALETASIQRS